MGRLAGKVAIVTGGGAGIGRGICEMFAAEGAKVAIVSRTAANGEETEALIKDKGYEAKFWQLDVSKEEQVKQVFAEVRAVYGKVDILINNAGLVGTPKITHEVTIEEFNQVFDVDVRGSFFCTKYAIPYMLEAGGGSIINIASIYAAHGSDDLAPYHAAKGALTAMSKTDAIAYAKKKIRVNTIHPGTIITPLLEKDAQRVECGPEAYFKLLEAKHPVGWLGLPEDVAYATVYLASDEARFVTGAELYVDGGYSAW